MSSSLRYRGGNAGAVTEEAPPGSELDTHVVQRDVISGRSRTPLLLLAAFIGVVFYFQLFWLPRPLSAEEAGIQGFSEERAFSHLNVLTSFGPKPVGSENLEHAIEYVLDAVKSIKARANPNVYMEIDDFRGKPGANRLQGGMFHGKTLAYAELRHVLVRLSSKFFNDADDNAILVSSHVDTVYTSEGGGDCGSCISVMLELVRALSHTAQGFKHAVIFLFNTGEEDGLDGAHNFVTQHEWSSAVRAVIDLEAMGAGGKSQIFQAPDTWLLDIFRRVAKFPSAQMVAQDVFYSGIIKSATDFQVYRELAGWTGLDFAYTENGAVYHTRNDKATLVRPGSMQHLGDNILPLLTEVARSDEIRNVKTSNYTERAKAVYFDILSLAMVVYSQDFGKTLYTSVLAQFVMLLGGSLVRAQPFYFPALCYGSFAILAAWLVSYAFAVAVAILVSYLTTSTLPYVAHPILAAGLFCSSSLSGAIVGHSFGHRLLYRYLVSKQFLSPQAEAERIMYKSALFQWFCVLGLGVLLRAGSSYLALAWLVSPAVAYGLLEASSNKRNPRRGLSFWTLFLALPVPVVLSASAISGLPSALIGNLVRMEGNPGSLPIWTGNILMAMLLATLVCLFSAYFLPYLHRGSVRRMLLLAVGVMLVSLAIVMLELVPAFTKHAGKGTYAVHVVEVAPERAQSESYVSVAFTTPGKFTKDVQPLVRNGFKCGETTGPDYVSFKVRRGCTKPGELDDQLWKERPKLSVQSDAVTDGRRSTTLVLQTQSSLRWVMSIDASKIQALSMDILKDQAAEILLPRSDITSGASGWHTVQFASGRNGPSVFRIGLEWRKASSKEEEQAVLKLRTDSRNVTKDAAAALRALPEWCVLFGKSTSPLNLAYLTKLQLPASL